jgi:hypothetical protein
LLPREGVLGCKASMCAVLQGVWSCWQPPPMLCELTLVSRVGGVAAAAEKDAWGCCCSGAAAGAAADEEGAAAA